MFQEGDIIVGKPNSYKEYPITNEYASMIVLDGDEDEDGNIEVELTDHDFKHDKIGEIYYIKPQYFMKKSDVNNTSATMSWSAPVPSQLPGVASKKAKTLKSKGLI